jgi:twitching motility protein PilT
VVDRINQSQARHIVTIEDPIETVHIGERSLVTQRELGSHTSSFPSALRAALREDPDVIVVGEMRDPETFQFAVSAAETGHLVLGTMHTASAETSVARIVNGFPPPQQPQVRAMLAASLRMVVCQALLRRKNGEGRIVAAEVMINNEAIANLIRKGKEFQIPTAIATARSSGMQLMDHELARLVRENLVEGEEAFARAVDKGAFEALVGGKDPALARSGAVPSARPMSVPPVVSPSMPPAAPRTHRPFRD